MLISTCYRARTAAKTAVDISVLDPQGFLDKDGHEPVIFIDVHVKNKPDESPGASKMLEQIDDYLKKK